MSHIFISLATLIGAFVIYVPIALWYSFVASILWGWFMVPIFGAPPLSVVQCWAVMLTISSFRPKINGKKSDSETQLRAIGEAVIGPPLSLAIGWFIKLWLM